MKVSCVGDVGLFMEERERFCRSSEERGGVLVEEGHLSRSGGVLFLRLVLH